MSIPVAPNPDYVNGVSAHDKYNPFVQTLKLDNNDQELLSRLLTNRITLLEYSGYDTSSLGLQLTVKSKDSLIKDSKGKAPPLVVISSGRGKWIQQGLMNCNAILRALQLSQFNGVMDLRALYWQARNFANYPSPPIYCPKRLGQAPNRNVYIVVHFNEYATYCDALKDYPAITVVGWNFSGLPLYEPVYDIRNPQPISTTLAGFGATRFAAIEFSKTLHELSGGSAKLAWHFDDNVVGMSEQFQGLKYYEDTLKIGQPCVGFAGLPVNYPRTWITQWAKQGGRDPRRTPGDRPKFPIFQQAVLWNIDFLIKTNMNFGLTYVASAEDVSLSKFMTAKGLAWWFFQAVAIVKETASDGPNDQGTQNVVKARRQFEEVFARVESLDFPGQPALTVETLINSKLENMNIRTFVDKCVTKGSNKVGLLDRAACQAVEQITKLAIGLKLVDQAAVDTFTKVKVTTQLR